MKRIAFKMRLKKGFETEYKKRHDEIWPELAALLKHAGIHDYSIFKDSQTNELFAVQKREEEHTVDISSDPIMRKWWDYMADIMEVNPDNSPVCIDLIEVFHLD